MFGGLRPYAEKPEVVRTASILLAFLDAAATSQNRRQDAGATKAKSPLDSC